VNTCNPYIVVIGFLMIFIGVSTFYTGWHNSDLTQNYFRIYSNYELNYSECVECGLGMGCIGCDDAYVAGNAIMITSIPIILFGGMLFGVGLVCGKHMEEEDVIDGNR